eukprot:992004_1
MTGKPPTYSWIIDGGGKSRRKSINYNFSGPSRAELHAWEFIECMQKHEGTQRMTFAKVVSLTEGDGGIWTLVVNEYKHDMVQYFENTSIERIKAKYSVRQRLKLLYFLCKSLAAL